MLDTDNFRFMIGTERVERRMIGAGKFLELRYRVTGVKFKGSTRHSGPSVIVFGECIEGAPRENHPNATWFGAYCSEVFYENPEQPETPVEQVEEPEAVAEPGITVEVVEQVLEAADFPHCVDPAGRRYGEFQVASLASGVRVTYSLGAAAAAMIPSMRRAAVAVQVDQCERVLSRLGYRVTVFEPDRGTRYALTVR